MTVKTGFCLDETCVAHSMGAHHPESPKRLEALIEQFESDALDELTLARLEPRLATAEDCASVHGAAYVQQLEATEGRSVQLDPDTLACPRSWEVARRAAGASLQCVDSVLAGQVRNAFALVRPPGHHAEPGHAMGFCLVNSVAVAAQHARNLHGLERVAIIDFDVHHGNGTQSAFWQDPAVLYVSSHQFPYYPGSGSPTQVGAPEAAGTTVNFPLPAGQGDETYAAIYGAILPRMLEQFRPDLILVSAGYDLMRGDPLAAMNVTVDGVRAIADSLVAAAERLCDGRLVMLLEGGYNLPNLKAGVKTTLESMNAQRGGSAPLPELDPTALGPVTGYLDLHREHYRI